MIEDSRVKSSTIVKVESCIRTARKPISASYISSTVGVDYNSLIKILDHLVEQNKIVRIETSGADMYTWRK